MLSSTRIVCTGHPEPEGTIDERRFVGYPIGRWNSARAPKASLALIYVPRRLWRLGIISNFMVGGALIHQMKDNAGDSKICSGTCGPMGTALAPVAEGNVRHSGAHLGMIFPQDSGVELKQRSSAISTVGPLPVAFGGCGSVDVLISSAHVH
ncbi:hypothetical protein EI94DRAFT_458151 [Lactarius quietus]|nr:hypothetical protein EI94DRAFT_458151 [Lactarius quietus]